MLTIAWALVVFLAAALLVVARMWWVTERECAAQDVLIRHQCERIESYRVELDALSIAGPPPAAAAALTPDSEPPVPAGWLDDLNQLPTTHEREYPL